VNTPHRNARKTVTNKKNSSISGKKKTPNALNLDQEELPDSSSVNAGNIISNVRTMESTSIVGRSSSTTRIGINRSKETNIGRSDNPINTIGICI